ncbi:damage-control phosphatase ARMT1 family protein [Fusibacter tunisiensis]|uniref:Uncharacterized protein with ATP-grasp and redox domains n=1 Tax=Fusibacter tunisiensis TaxID=1008308 RepID=A0ABS2MTV1_9FIRM|nr:ARMT1-like domain-containing protein [Fusibacter tunisiensis]MBM7562838.1 uncharacterized protein with ATP-grasp and redox domains [Fusibacter tunisiensis]
MKIKHECIPCLIRQAIEISDFLIEDPEKKKDVIRFTLKMLSEISFEETAPYLAMKVHHYVKSISGNMDPYKPFKVKFNQIAEDLIASMRLRELVANSKFPFDTACRLAIAGNVIDFGLEITIDQDKVERSIASGLSCDLHGMETEILYKRIEKAKNIMVITDNAGEIVFDKLLIEQMPMKKIVYVVKGGPIVNDATIEDAIDVGMTKLVTVIDNGLAAQGTIMELVSNSFLEAFTSADLILAKGQANFETLSDLKDSRIVFLLKAKCKSIADEIGCQKGDYVIGGV